MKDQTRLKSFYMVYFNVYYFIFKIKHYEHKFSLLILLGCMVTEEGELNQEVMGSKPIAVCKILYS